jgi:hypothetical protein
MVLGDDESLDRSSTLARHTAGTKANTAQYSLTLAPPLTYSEAREVNGPLTNLGLGTSTSLTLDLTFGSPSGNSVSFNGPFPPLGKFGAGSITMSDTSLQFSFGFGIGAGLPYSINTTQEVNSRPLMPAITQPSSPVLR